LTNFFWHKNVHTRAFLTVYLDAAVRKASDRLRIVCRAIARKFLNFAFVRLFHIENCQCSFIVHQSGQLTPAFTASWMQLFQ